MPRRRAAALATGSFVLALAGLGLAIAQQPPPAAEKKTPTDAAAPAPAAPAATKPEAAAPAASTPAGSETPAPSKPAAAKGTPQRFEPTEKVRPDFDVAFPIDI